MYRISLTSVGLAVLALLVASARINHGLVDSNLPAGPGLTLDESFNIEQGDYLVNNLGQHGPLLLTPEVASVVFSDQRYLPDHPPLGRLLLGTTHEATSWMISGAEQSVYNVPAARLGSCLAFAATVLLLAEFARRRYDLATSIIAALVLISMPRVIGHSRIASLETATSLFWLAATLPLASWWTGTRPPRLKVCVISGVLFGLLLLTKVQGILLPPLVVAWAVYRFRFKAAAPLAVWGIVGGFVFFVCWPWLWQDPMNHIRQYLGRATERQTLYCWYFGVKYADKLVPWHFPFVMTLLTLPLSALAGLAARSIARQWTSIDAFLGLTALWPLVVFALPGTPVYDGTRLFLIIMPAIALTAARGICLLIPICWHFMERRFNKRPETMAVERAAPWCGPSALAGRMFVGVVMVGMFAASVSTILSPFALDAYGPLALGFQGADKLGMEAGYWADGLNGEFWEQVPAGSVVSVAPVLHQYQLPAIQALVPVVAQRKIRLQSFQYDSTQQRGLLLLIHRLADLRPSLQQTPEGARSLVVVRNGNMVLAELVDTTNATWVEKPEPPPQ